MGRIAAKNAPPPSPLGQNGLFGVKIAIFEPKKVQNKGEIFLQNFHQDYQRKSRESTQKLSSATNPGHSRATRLDSHLKLGKKVRVRALNYFIFQEISFISVGN